MAFGTWAVLNILTALDHESVDLTRPPDVLHLAQMRNTISVRLPEHLAEWLKSSAAKAGVSQGRVIREQLEKARGAEARPFLRLAGKISGPSDLSSRKGFSKK